MKKIILTSVLILFSCFASATPCDNMVLDKKFPQTIEKVTIICKTRFVIGYSTARKAPLWVAEVLSDSQVKAANTIRINSFRPDPSIPLNLQSSLSEFSKSGYDRGHMVPFEDVSDDPIAANESFILTNMIAQAQFNNRGIWRSVEIKARKLAISRKEIFIITGTVFPKDPMKLSKGTNIPSHIWKIIISPSTNEVFSVLVPNINDVTTAALAAFSSTPNKIEKEARITIHGLNSTYIKKPIN